MAAWTDTHFKPKPKKDMEENNNTALATAPQGSLLTAFSDLPQMLQVADMLSKSTLVPERFRGDQGSTLIALDMASRMGVNPLMVLQNTYVVYGQPSFSGQFAIACLRNSRRYKEVRFEYLNGKDYTGGMRVVGVRADGSPDDVGTSITPELVASMGWMSKRDSMWQKMPEQMYKYRAASWFVKTCCPDLLMGIPTSDELEDAGAPAGMRDVTPAKPKARGMRASKAPASLAAADAEPTPAADAVEVQAEPAAAPEAPEDSGALDRLRAAMKASGVGIKALYGILDAAGISRPEIGAAPDEFAAWAEKLLADKDAVNVLEKNGVHVNDGKEA